MHSRNTSRMRMRPTTSTFQNRLYQAPFTNATHETEKSISYVDSKREA